MDDDRFHDLDDDLFPLCGPDLAPARQTKSRPNDGEPGFPPLLTSHQITAGPDGPA